MDNASVHAAIRIHGAPAVFRAASDWMAGSNDLVAMGVACTRMVEAWDIMGMAHEQMDDVQRAIDYAQANAELSDYDDR